MSGEARVSRERMATLAHDVGKYLARVAHNVPPGGPFPRALAPLLARDLYELPSGGRASARFEALAAGLDDASLHAARALLTAVDALEARVRAGDEEACVEACEHAREIEALLRALANEARASSDGSSR